MTSTYSQAAMTATAAVVIASNANRKRLVLKNIGSNTVFIGSTSAVVVTANNANGGYPVYAGEELNLNDYTGVVYGICDTALTSTMNVIEEELA